VREFLQLINIITQNLSFVGRLYPIGDVQLNCDKITQWLIEIVIILILLVILSNSYSQLNRITLKNAVLHGECVLTLTIFTVLLDG